MVAERIGYRNRWSPTACRELFGGAAEVFCYGVSGFGPALSTNAYSADRDEERLQCLIRIAETLGITTVWWTNSSTMNGRLAREKDFCTLRRVGDTTIMFGAVAAGCFVPKGEAGCRTSADCPTIVVYNRSEGDVCQAHAGRDEILPRAAIKAGQFDPEQDGLIANVLERIDPNGWQRQEIFVEILLSIQPQHFIHHPNDPEWGEYNQRLIVVAEKYEAVLTTDRGPGLDLPRLIAGLFTQFGVPPQNIVWDGVDTWSDARWHSHVREGKKRTGSNLILVRRKH